MKRLKNTVAQRPGTDFAQAHGEARSGHTPVTMRASLSLGTYLAWILIISLALVPTMGCVVTDVIDFEPALSQAPLIKDTTNTALPIGGLSVFNINQTRTVELKAIISERNVEAIVYYRTLVNGRLLGNDSLPVTPDRSVDRDFRLLVSLDDLYSAGNDVPGGRCRLIEVFFSTELLGDSTVLTSDKVSTAIWWMGLVQSDDQVVDMRLCPPRQQLSNTSSAASVR